MNLSPPREPGSRRRLAARVASRVGILRAVRHTRLNRGLLVLAYHRVGSMESCPTDPELMTVTAEGLADHIRILQRWTRVASLEDVGACYRARRSIREPVALVTFDDAYADNYHAAFPVLQRAGVPAVFFVPTGLIETNHVPWWDRIAYAVRHTQHDSLRLSYPAGLMVIGARAAPENSTRHLLRRFKSDASLEPERFLRSIEDAAGVRAAGAPEVGELFANWSELREMAGAGMTLASHTHTHAILSHLPYGRQCEELERSRATLRERAGVDTSAVAYPVGGRDHFNGDTRRALAALGYDLGFSHYGGWNRAAEDAYDIRRVRVDRSVDPEMLLAAASLPRLFAS